MVSLNLLSLKKQKRQKKLDDKAVQETITAKSSMTNEYGYTHQREGLEEPYTAEEMSWLKAKGLKTEYAYSEQVKVPIHPSCITCQARHIVKYEGHPNTEDKPPFGVRCKGIPGKLPDGAGELIEKLSTQKGMEMDRASLFFRSSADPVAWAELMFGFRPDDPEWNIRWYQAEALRCTSPRMVLRWGRRSGKSFTMALKLLHAAFTKLSSKGLDSEGKPVMAGAKIIIATPFQAQLTNIFNEMEELIKRNVDLVSQVTSKHGGSLYTKSPFFLIELVNGASISGFVTGVEIRQDGSAGGSIRGQSGTIIYVDEMDMIPEEVLEKVIIPILATKGDTTFYATSTPIGKTGKFYDLAFNRPDFKEMWLPSTVLPQWESFKPELEYANPEDDAFKAEYMAVFVESTSGVFKSADVYNAMSHYTYQDTALDGSGEINWWRTKAGVRNRATDLVTVIGVDWNKNAGSEFVVICYDQVNHFWWIADAVNITGGEYSSITFKEAVWRLNYKWKPDYIYADEGYGHHIIDDIRFEAYRIGAVISDPVQAADLSDFDRQKARLGTQLKKFNFSQKVELVNPVDNTPLERTGKEFLVENAIRVFEEGRIKFPADDDTLKTQMLNYCVLKRHKSNNRPVYGMKNSNVGDHRLDAMMLALGGLFLERHPLYSRNASAGTGLEGGLVKRDVLMARQENHGEHPGIAAGLGIDLLRINRGGEDTPQRKAQRMEKEAKSQNSLVPQPGGPRKQFPGNPVRRANANSMLELWGDAPSADGYETDTRPLYEAMAKARKQTQSSSRGEFFSTEGDINSGFGIVTRKSSNKGTRSGAW